MARRPSARPRARQRGVALITVLLVVALATIAATDMTRQGQLDRRRTGNRLALEQAHQVALGGERWAMAILGRDRRGRGDDWKEKYIEEQQGRNVDIDARDERWARELPPIPIEGGRVGGRITDAQGRFNVNSLLDGRGRIDAVALARFERLLAAVGIAPDAAQAVVDWLDDNAETTYPRGAEDDYYAGLERPYRAANAPLATASELRLVRGIGADAWAALAPHVTALPGRTAINVNTASTAVLRAVVPGLDAAGAETLVEELGDEPVEDVASFVEHPLVRGARVETEGLDVGSRHFRVRIDVEMGPIVYTLYSWLRRDENGRSVVLRRSRTPS